MKANQRQYVRVLSVYPHHRGFGFAVLEHERLVDWGLARLYSKGNDEFLARVEAMMVKYRPHIIALEDHMNSRRGERAQRLVDTVLGYAKFREVETVLVVQSDVRRILGLQERATIYDVATCLAEAFPELTPLVPPKRRPWQSEAERMKVFQALGLAIVAFPRSSPFGPAFVRRLA